MPATLDYMLRLTEPGDLARLDALFGRSYPKLLKKDYPPSLLVTAIPIIARAQPALVASGTFHVAERPDGQIIAAGGWTPRGAGSTVGDVRHVVCDDRFLRRGVASALMRRAMRQARAAGIRRLDCKSTRTAVRFYEALGFTRMAPIEIPLRPGIVFPAVRMERRL